MLLGQPASPFHRHQFAGCKTHRDSVRRSVTTARTPSRRRPPPNAASRRQSAKSRGRAALFSDHYFERPRRDTRVHPWENLFSGPGLVWSVGASLRKHFLTPDCARPSPNKLGRNTKHRRETIRQIVLTAFQEVEDQFNHAANLSQNFNNRNAAVESSQSYLTLANARYQSGLDKLPDVITAPNHSIDHQRTASEPRDATDDGSVQLIKALGGAGIFAWNDRGPFLENRRRPAPSKMIKTQTGVTFASNAETHRHRRRPWRLRVEGFLAGKLRSRVYEVVDFATGRPKEADDYPEFYRAAGQGDRRRDGGSRRGHLLAKRVGAFGLRKQGGGFGTQIGRRLIAVMDCSSAAHRWGGHFMVWGYFFAVSLIQRTGETARLSDF